MKDSFVILLIIVLYFTLKMYDSIFMMDTRIRKIRDESRMGSRGGTAG